MTYTLTRTNVRVYFPPLPSPPRGVKPSSRTGPFGPRKLEPRDKTSELPPRRAVERAGGALSVRSGLCVATHPADREWESLFFPFFAHSPRLSLPRPMLCICSA